MTVEEYLTLDHFCNKKAMQTKSDTPNKTMLLMFITGLEASLIIMLLFFPKSLEGYTSAFIVCSAIYLLMCIVVFKNSLKERDIILLIGFWFLLKILFLTYQPIGSDDYYRYLWDGKVQLNGINPFLYAPNDQRLNSLHSELLPAKVSYPNIKTIYFPVSQVLFVVSSAIGSSSVWGLKLFLLLCDILILVSLYFLFRKLDLPIKYILLYAALPLIHFQFFIDAHIDIAGAALMMAAITLYLYQKKYFGYVLLGLSLSIKPPAILLLPFFFQKENTIKGKTASIVLPVSILILSFLPYVFTASPIETLINYSSHWTFNGMIYNFVQILISDNYTIRIICGALYIAVYAVLFFSKLDFFKKIYLSIFLLMIFSPIVHPWYLIWFAVLLPITRSFSGLYFVSAVSLTFFTVMNFQTTNNWMEYPVVLLAEYLPIVILFFYEMIKLKFDWNIFERSIPE